MLSVWYGHRSLDMQWKKNFKSTAQMIKVNTIWWIIFEGFYFLKNLHQNLKLKCVSNGTKIQSLKIKVQFSSSECSSSSTKVSVMNTYDK